MANALEKGFEAGFLELLKKLDGESKIPSSVRSKLASTLAGQVAKAKPVEAAYQGGQKLLMSWVAYVKQRLGLTDKVDSLKAKVEGSTTSVASLPALNQKITETTKAISELDKAYEKSLGSSVKLTPSFSISPSLVLDPTRLFIKEIDADVGLTIKTNGATLTLSTELRVTSPLLLKPASLGFNPDLGATLTPSAKLTIFGNNQTLNLGVTYSKGFLQAADIHRLSATAKHNLDLGNGWMLSTSAALSRDFTTSKTEASVFTTLSVSF